MADLAFFAFAQHHFQPDPLRWPFAQLQVGWETLNYANLGWSRPSFR
jgi:hypothetical protein